MISRRCTQCRSDREGRRTDRRNKSVEGHEFAIGVFGFSQRLPVLFDREQDRDVQHGQRRAGAHRPAMRDVLLCRCQFARQHGMRHLGSRKVSDGTIARGNSVAELGWQISATALA